MSLFARSRVASRGMLPRPAESISLILLSLAKRISNPGIPYKQEGTESNLKLLFLTIDRFIRFEALLVVGQINFSQVLQLVKYRW